MKGVIITILVLFVCGILGQDGVNVNFDPFDLELEEEATIKSSPDVTTAYVFPKYPHGKFPVGSQIEVLMAFRNKGASVFNISHVDASFNYPLDYSYYIQNFTKKEYGYKVDPNSELSLAYKFLPDPLLETRDFGLVVNVYYHDFDVNGERGTNFTSVIFNSTVDVIEAEGGFDAQVLFAYLAILAVLGLLGYILYRNLATWRKRQKRKGPYEAQTAAQTEVMDNSWLQGTSADPNLHKGRKGSAYTRNRNKQKNRNKKK